MDTPEYPQDDRRALDSVFTEDQIMSMMPPRRDVTPNTLRHELERQKAITLATSKRQPKKKMRGRKGRQHKRHKK